MDISTIFSNPAWKFSAAVAYPNHLGRLDQDGITIGVVIVFRKKGLALGVNGLEYLMKAEQEGRITTGHVVLAQANGRCPEYITDEKAAVVYERLRDYVPYEGRLGPHWWITV